MKEILIMRHAKSSWSDADLTDFERPLNKRGRSDAARMAKLLGDQNLVPDAIISSSAQRTRETVSGLMDVWGEPKILEYSQALYLGGFQDFLDSLWRLDSSTERALLVGHNPGAEMVVEIFGRRTERMQTAAIAHFAMDIEQWGEINEDSGAEFKNLWRPKEI
jgi:phosphohistidine phosphatase